MCQSAREHKQSDQSSDTDYKAMIPSARDYK